MFKPIQSNEMIKKQMASLIACVMFMLRSMDDEEDSHVDDSSMIAELLFAWSGKHCIH